MEVFKGSVMKCKHCSFEPKIGSVLKSNADDKVWMCSRCKKWNDDNDGTPLYLHGDKIKTYPTTDKGAKYRKEVPSTTIDVYDVLVAFDVVNPATQHAIKKLLAGGKRGHKDLLTDLNEAKHSIDRAIELEQ